MNIDYYFPTPIWWTDINIDNQFILEYCYSLNKKDPIGRRISNNGGWQSSEIDAVKDLPELVNSIMNYSRRTIDDYGYDYEKTKLFFGNSWVNINKQGNTNQIHLHHGSFLSGVYYVRANNNSGKINFYRNFDQSYITSSFARITNPTAISSDTCFYPAKTGRLIIFPSNLLHSVESSSDNEDRISLAFNIGIRYD